MATKYEVEQGDTLLGIAHTHRFSDARLLRDHAGNADLRAKRPDLGTLFPGDVVFIPDKVPETFLCRTEHQHVFRIQRPRAKLALVLEDEDGQPLAGKRYQIEVGGRKTEGRIPGDGRVREDIPADATAGEITVWPD